MNATSINPDDLPNLLAHFNATVLIFDTHWVLVRTLGRSKQDVAAVGSTIEEVAAAVGDPALPAIARRNLMPDVPSSVSLIERTDGQRLVRRLTPYLNTEGVQSGCCVSYADLEADLATTRKKTISQQAHDLRTPLGVILMWAKLMRSRPMGQTEQSNGLDAIIRSAEHQQTLIDQFLKDK